MIIFFGSILSFKNLFVTITSELFALLLLIKSVSLSKFKISKLKFSLISKRILYKAFKFNILT